MSEGKKKKGIYVVLKEYSEKDVSVYDVSGMFINLSKLPTPVLLKTAQKMFRKEFIGGNNDSAHKVRLVKIILLEAKSNE